jgi:hypothetical protein
MQTQAPDEGRALFIETLNARYFTESNRDGFDAPLDSCT